MISLCVFLLFLGCLIHISGETVDFQDSDFKVPARAEGRVVERGAVIGFSISDVFVHPYRLAFTEIGISFKMTSMKRLVNLPSSNCDHLTIGRHKELGSMRHVSLSIHANPWIFGTFRIQGEQERFPGAKVGLSIAAIVFLVAFAPSRRTIGTKHLSKSNFSWHLI